MDAGTGGATQVSPLGLITLTTVGLDYATNLAPQIITIQNMVSAITGV